VVGYAVPILFVFNKYRFDADIIEELSRLSLQEKEAKKETIIKQAIQEGVDKVIAGEEKNLTSVAEKIGRHLKKSEKVKVNLFSQDSYIDEEILNHEEFKKSLYAVSYVAFLKYNIKDQVNMVYIDPMSIGSKKKLHKALNQLSPISENSLVFNGYSTERVIFEEAFADRVGLLLLLLMAKTQVSKYSIKLLEELKEEANECLKYHRKIFSSIKDLTGNNLELMMEAYATPFEDKENLSREYDEEMKRINQKIGPLTQEYTILSKEPVLYWTVIWKRECGFFSGWWRNYHCVYPYKTKYIKWIDDLDDDTQRKEIVQDNSPHLELVYSSSLGADCKGILRVYVHPKDDKYTSNDLLIKDYKIQQLKTEMNNIQSKKTIY